MYEIRWHSRAGHGAITAANALCEIIGKNNFTLHTQSFPDYGAEKKGAPLVVFNRFSEHPIENRDHVQSPNLCLLLDTSLINPSELSYQNILKGMNEKGILLLNTTQKSTKFNTLHTGSIYHVDATNISIDAIGKNIPNVPMLGALLRISKLLSKEQFLPALEQYLSQGLSPKIVEGNLKAFEKGYEEVFFSHS